VIIIKVRELQSLLVATYFMVTREPIDPCESSCTWMDMALALVLLEKEILLTDVLNSYWCNYYVDI
jgi:hypothetical protein